jgi:hypothetical protein
MKLLFALLVSAALAQYEGASYDYENDYDGNSEQALAKDRRSDVETIEGLLENLTEEDQIKFMIEHLEKEKEAEERQEAFDNITPEAGENVTEFQQNGEVVIQQQESEVTEDWQDDVPLDSSQASGYDKEDKMSEDEWLEYYDENLAQSSADSKRLS